LLPAPKSAPGAMPDEPNFGPPGPGVAPTPSGRSSGAIRVRPRATAQDAIATPADAKEQRNQRVSWGEPKEATPLKPAATRINGDSAGPGLSPDAEPDLIIPSLSSRPLRTSNVDSRNDRSASNPLREDIRIETVTPVMLIDSDSATISSDRPAGPAVASGSAGTVRSNPLRRN
jgi:hypothetical protein